MPEARAHKCVRMHLTAGRAMKEISTKQWEGEIGANERGDDGLLKVRRDGDRMF